MCSNAVSCRSAMTSTLPLPYRSKRPMLPDKGLMVSGPGHLAGRGTQATARASAGVVSHDHERSVRMNTSSDARQTAGTTAAKGGWLRSIAMIVIFDIGGPLVAYKALRSAGLST